MLLSLPQGSHEVEVRFRRTWDRIAGGAISLLSGLGLLGYAWNSRRRAARLGGAFSDAGCGRYLIGLWVNFFSPLTYSATVWPLPYSLNL